MFACFLLAGCKKATDTATCPNWTFYIPNSFTPADNGINNVFEPKGTGVASYEMWVLDNSSKQVFYTKDPNYGWDGTVNGNTSNKCPEGTYSYKINVTDSCGLNHSYAGNVFLVR